MPDLLKNTRHSYSVVAVALHWLIAFTLFGLFGLGLWMVELDYYDPWYRDAPDLHRSIGILVVAAMLVRLVVRLMNPQPDLPDSMSAWQVVVSRVTQHLFYGLVLLTATAGYLMSTADGRPVSVFGWFEVPATMTALANQEDLMGEIHEWLAYGLAALVVLHAAAAIKHHFVDKDDILRRMLGLSRSATNTQPFKENQ